MTTNSLDTLLSQIEEDKMWREEELRFFENQLANIRDNSDKQKFFSKALILLLYSIFEGHVKFIFECYVREINNQRLNCKDVITELTASNLNRIFEEFKNTQRIPKNHPIFKKEHSKGFVELGRRIEFLDNLDQIMSSPIYLDVSKIVDTESNLTKDVLLRILFRIGFDNNILDTHIQAINKLLEFCNAIAHGSRKNGWSYDEYIDIKTNIFDLISLIRHSVITNFSGKKFLRNFHT